MVYPDGGSEEGVRETLLQQLQVPREMLKKTVFVPAIVKPGGAAAVEEEEQVGCCCCCWWWWWWCTVDTDLVVVRDDFLLLFWVVVWGWLRFGWWRQ